MKNWYLLLSGFALFLVIVSHSSICYGQDEPDSTEVTEGKNTRMDISFGFGKNCNLNTFQWAKFWGLGESKSLNLGGGFRLNNFNYKDLRYYKRGTDESGFTEFNASGRVFAVNIMLSAEYLWNNKIGIGGNIDLVGFSIGVCNPSSDSSYSFKGEAGTFNPGTTPGRLGAEPTGLNVLLGPNKDQGCLNSEIYGVIKLKKRTWLKIGYSHVFSEVQLNQTEDRYGNYSNVYFVGLRWKY